MLKILFTILLNCIIWLPIQASEENLEIYFVRHAEKVADGTRDPVLTAQGKKRATKLADILKSRGISEIYSTKFKRTIETVKPLSDEIKVQISIYNPFKLDEFAVELKKKKGIVLVVGHSNTTPQLVELLGGNSGDKMDETIYDRLYHLNITSEGVQTELTSY